MDGMDGRMITRRYGMFERMPPWPSDPTPSSRAVVILPTPSRGKGEERRPAAAAYSSGDPIPLIRSLPPPPPQAPIHSAPRALPPMGVTTRLPAPPGGGLQRRAPRGILPASLPVERPARRRLAPGVRAASGIPGPGGSPVPRRTTPASADAAAAAPPSAASSASSAIDFLTLCHRLKTTKRKGWINHSIKGPESIADHMYRMALMALIAGDLPAVDRERCIKIAIVHDIAEAIVGDITPSDGIPKAEKSRREQKALNEMCEVLGGGPIADEIKELWEEYENNSSIEANLVKDFDKVEMILQALEYEKEHGKVLDEFFLSTAGKFQTEIGKSWAAEVNARREQRCGKQK
uniref:5'-deoxynucleotidase n=1 Tax=Oryza meridionalis TaxID=40149 RepID=A0A0E0C583_9ORYZ